MLMSNVLYLPFHLWMICFVRSASLTPHQTVILVPLRTFQPRSDEALEAMNGAVVGGGLSVSASVGLLLWTTSTVALKKKKKKSRPTWKRSSLFSRPGSDLDRCQYEVIVMQVIILSLEFICLACVVSLWVKLKGTSCLNLLWSE